MPTVANRADPSGGLDEPLTTYNRKLGASPVGSTTPLYAGEIVLDTASNKIWKAEGLTNDTWVSFYPVIAP